MRDSGAQGGVNCGTKLKVFLRSTLVCALETVLVIVYEERGYCLPCPSTQNLPEDKLKSDGLTVLTDFKIA